jgi:hypothetical protein
MNCEKHSIINCTSNLSSIDDLKTQNQQNNDKLLKFFQFLSTVLFLVVSGVILINAFSHIRVYEHVKCNNKRKAIKEMLKDITIFLFIIPFAYLLIFFVFLISNAFGEFLAAGLLIFYVTVYIAEIFVVMFLMLRYLFGLQGDRKKENQFGIICSILGFGSAAIFWFLLPDFINFTFSISMALLLMAIIAFIRPYIEK